MACLRSVTSGLKLGETQHVPVQVRIIYRVCDEGSAVVLHEDIAIRHGAHTHFSTIRTADLEGFGIGIKFDDL